MLKKLSLFIPVLAIALATTHCSKKPVVQAPPEPEPMVEAAPEPEPMAEPTGPSEAELRRQRMQERLAAVMKPIYFELDQTTLSAESKQTLAGIGGVLKEYPEIESLTIEGHADERGTDEYNFALADRRASTIKSYLDTFGVDSQRLVTVSFGEEKPAVMGKDEDAFSKNRRGEFVPKE